MRERVGGAGRGRCIAELVLVAGLLTSARSAGAQEAAPPPPVPYAPPPPVYYAPPPEYYAPPEGAPPEGAPAPRREPQAVIYDWDPDAPVPSGYRRVDHANGRLLGMGIGLLSGAYSTSALIGSIAADVEGSEPTGPNDKITAKAWYPMFIPIAGPFMVIATTRPRPSLTGLLILDGVVQIAGTVGIVLGVVYRNHRLVRTEVSRRFEIMPAVGPGFQGLSATGRF